MSGGSEDTSPVLITHWDPDLYPGNAMPAMRELAVQVLTSKVLIKDVDLLLNRKIRESFRDPAVVRQFDSLLHTGRIQVLVPPKSMLSAVDVDPDKRPMTAVLRERQKKARPLKTRVPEIGRPDERFCAELDNIIVSAEAVRFRHDFATENTFARKLGTLLSKPDQRWRLRPQFRAITPRMAEDFAGYCEYPHRAVTLLEERKIKPNALEFYRSLGYQVTELKDLYDQPARRAMKNLLQSVYADLELTRESAQGTYSGTRIAELPPMLDLPKEGDLLDLQPLIFPDVVDLPLAENIGNVIGRVIEECGSLDDLWGPTKGPQQAINVIRERWAHIADAFAKHSVHARPVRWTAKAEQRWHLTHRLHFAVLLIEGALYGAEVISDFKGGAPVEKLLYLGNVLALCSKPVVDWIRMGKAYDDRDTERARVRRILLNALGIRVAEPSES